MSYGSTNYNDFHNVNSLIALFDQKGIQSLLMLDKTAEGTLQHPERGDSRTITNLSAQKLTRDDFRKAHNMQMILDGLSRGSVGFVQKNNTVSFGGPFGGTLRSNVVITVKRNSDFNTIGNSPQRTRSERKPIQPQISEEGGVSLEDRETRTRGSQREVEQQPREIPTVLNQQNVDRAPQSLEQNPQIDDDMDVDAPDADEVESFSHFEEMSAEEYDKFLAQIHKIMDNRAEEKKSSTSSTSHDNKPKAKASERDASKRKTTLEQHKKTDKTLPTDPESTIVEKRASQEKNRLEAAKEKDKIADEKKDRAIKSDLTKTETKKTSEKQDLIIDHEINEAALNQMLENNEISEAEMHELSAHAYINKKTLQDLSTKGLIKEETYNKLIKAYEK